MLRTSQAAKTKMALGASYAVCCRTVVFTEDNFGTNKRFALSLKTSLLPGAVFEIYSRRISVEVEC